MIKKTFIVISLSDRVDALNLLVDSIIRNKKFDDYDLNLIYQDYMNNRDLIRNKYRYKNIFYYDRKLGCHGARVQLLKDLDIENYDIFINLDDDMELVKETNYDIAIDKALKSDVGFVLTNWARSEKILDQKKDKMSNTFIKQIMVYQGGGMVYSKKIAELVRELEVCHSEFDDIWSITSYINGYTNYRFLGSLAIHRVCGKGGMQTYMKENIRPLLCKDYINYRIGKNGIEVLIPNDSDVNNYARQLHLRNLKK